MQLISVVLPAPFGPISPVTFPCGMRHVDAGDGVQTAEMPRNVGEFKQGKSL